MLFLKTPAITSKFSLRISRRGKFDLFTRNELQPLFDEMKNNENADLYDPATTSQFGRMLGAQQYLVVGKVTGIVTKGNVDYVYFYFLRLAKPFENRSGGVGIFVGEVACYGEH